MKDKKEIIKNIVIVVIVLFIIIYNFFIKEENYEETNASDIIFTNEEKIEEKKSDKIKVYIIGEVNNPGVVEIDEGDRIEDAIILAGGTTNKSDLSKINLACVLEDGEKIRIPSIDDKSEMNYEEESDKDKKININKANVNELCELSGVGESLAQKIIDYRNENGKFKNIEDLKKVTGIGEKKYESLKNYITIK